MPRSCSPGRGGRSAPAARGVSAKWALCSARLRPKHRGAGRLSRARRRLPWLGSRCDLIPQPATDDGLLARPPAHPQSPAPARGRTQDGPAVPAEPPHRLSPVDHQPLGEAQRQLAAGGTQAALRGGAGGRPHVNNVVVCATGAAAGSRRLAQRQAGERRVRCAAPRLATQVQRRAITGLSHLPHTLPYKHCTSKQRTHALFSCRHAAAARADAQTSRSVGCMPSAPPRRLTGDEQELAVQDGGGVVHLGGGAASGAQH